MRHLLSAAIAAGLGLGVSCAIAQVPNHVPVKTGYEVKGCTHYILEHGTTVRQICSTWELVKQHKQRFLGGGASAAAGSGAAPK